MFRYFFGKYIIAGAFLADKNIATTWYLHLWTAVICRAKQLGRDRRCRFDTEFPHEDDMERIICRRTGEDAKSKSDDKYSRR